MSNLIKCEISDVIDNPQRNNSHNGFVEYKFKYIKFVKENVSITEKKMMNTCISISFNKMTHSCKYPTLKQETSKLLRLQRYGKLAKPLPQIICSFFKPLNYAVLPMSYETPSTIITRLSIFQFNLVHSLILNKEKIIIIHESIHQRLYLITTLRVKIVKRNVKYMIK
ncbi:LOW QUALITY PROTEIN: hypothetical protein V1478_013676 [Vespula squamosa]|uniref:Uncharacterized protein n=1 Tax=Vespula squamosa TaxID=30214 RepID=A0ABD2A8E2_VESSQ